MRCVKIEADELGDLPERQVPIVREYAEDPEPTLKGPDSTRTLTTLRGALSHAVRCDNLGATSGRRFSYHSAGESALSFSESQAEVRDIAMPKIYCLGRQAEFADTLLP
jgi:hypothetical protein